MTKVNTIHGKITLNKLETEENFLQTTKDIYENPTAKIILKDGRLKCFVAKTETRQGYLLLPLFTQHYTGASARAIDQEKKATQTGKEEVELSRFAYDII